MTNRNNNRERKDKYPNNKKTETEFSNEIHLRGETAKKFKEERGQ